MLVTDEESLPDMTTMDMLLPAMDMPLPGPPMVDMLLPAMVMLLPGSPTVDMLPHLWICPYQNLPWWIHFS